MVHSDGERQPIAIRYMGDGLTEYYDWLIGCHKQQIVEDGTDAHALIHKLLSIKPRAVYLSFVWDRKKISHKSLLENGTVRPHPSILIQMLPSQCWNNSVKLSKAINGTIVAGYAWRDDEMDWRAHTWVEKDGLIIETTCDRDLYFGIEVT
jgi:hypothetical protein